jgi:hypothetical protein
MRHSSPRRATGTADLVVGCASTRFAPSPPHHAAPLAPLTRPASAPPAAPAARPGVRRGPVLTATAALGFPNYPRVGNLTAQKLFTRSPGSSPASAFTIVRMRTDERVVEVDFAGIVCAFRWAMSGARMAIPGAAPGTANGLFALREQLLSKPACQRRISISVSPKRAWK